MLLSLALTVYYRNISHFAFSLTIYLKRQRVARWNLSVIPRFPAPNPAMPWRVHCRRVQQKRNRTKKTYLHPQPASQLASVLERTLNYTSTWLSYCDSWRRGCSVSDELCGPAVSFFFFFLFFKADVVKYPPCGRWAWERVWFNVTECFMAEQGWLNVLTLITGNFTLLKWVLLCRVCGWCTTPDEKQIALIN